MTADASNAVPRVAFDGVSKRYPGVQALAGVSFAAAAGSVHALVGENGAGKSTLMKILAGATRADAGEIRLDGESVRIRDARHAQSLGVSIVYQEFNLAPDLSVAENIHLGRWPHHPLTRSIRYRKLNAAAQALLTSLGVDLPVRRRVGGLSVAQQQMVEIARALSHDARVLVLDEPSAVLTLHELEVLFRIVRRLAERGVTVLYISHRLEEIFELADTVTVLRDGRHITTKPIGDVTRRQLIEDMVGRPIEDEYPPRLLDLGPPILRVDRLSAPPRFDPLSFQIRRGEVFGLTGLVGSGRSSVGKALFGAVRNARGSVTLGEHTGPFRSPSAAMRAGVAFVPEDRKQEGLLLERRLRDNITLAHARDLSTFGVRRMGEERDASRRMMADMRIKAPIDTVPAGALSGGNQQKVMLARWLMKQYAVIILDEPTRGVDVGAKAEIYGLINAMAAEGAAILMISSELPEVIGMADRIGVMSEGRLAGVLDNAMRDTQQAAILELAVSGAQRSATA